MRFQEITSAAAAAIGLASAAPVAKRAFSDPTADGFPNPNATQLAAIGAVADGQIPNGPPPPKLAPSSLTAFQLIAFNENFEVAFFSSLLQNITDGVPGFELDGEEKEQLTAVLKTVIAQEELHAIDALDVLEHFDTFAPAPCTYKFPTADVRSAVALAETFTALVLGTLQDAAALLASNGDAGPVRTVASVIGQEGEQNGWYRALLGDKPSEKAFLTASVAPFALSALQQFVAECPFDVEQEIPIPVFPALSVQEGGGGADVSPRDQLLTFSAELAAYCGGGGGGGGDGSTPQLFVTYLTGQNAPVSVPAGAASCEGSVVTVQAEFPFVENAMWGLTIAALTTSGTFASFDDVANATLAAPGLVQVNDRL